MSRERLAFGNRFADEEGESAIVASKDDGSSEARSGLNITENFPRINQFQTTIFKVRNITSCQICCLDQRDRI